MKKIILIATLLIYSFGFPQKNPTEKRVDESTIKNISSYPNPFSVATKISFYTEKNQTIILNIKKSSCNMTLNCLTYHALTNKVNYVLSS